MLNLKIRFLQTAGGGLMVKLAFLGDFGTFLYANLHNVSFFQISLRSWQMWCHIEALNCGSSSMCSFGSFSGCHVNGNQELIKKGEKTDIFCNLSDT